MTFEQFQATRKWTDDLTDAVGFDPGCPGFVYDWRLHIFADGGGASPVLYRLVIGNSETVSESLEDLEAELYEFACDEGFIERPALQSKEG